MPKLWSFKGSEANPSNKLKQNDFQSSRIRAHAYITFTVMNGLRCAFTWMSVGICQTLFVLKRRNSANTSEPQSQTQEPHFNLSFSSLHLTFSYLHRPANTDGNVGPWGPVRAVCTQPSGCCMFAHTFNKSLNLGPKVHQLSNFEILGIEITKVSAGVPHQWLKNQDWDKRG